MDRGLWFPNRDLRFQNLFLEFKVRFKDLMCILLVIGDTCTLRFLRQYYSSSCAFVKCAY